MHEIDVPMHEIDVLRLFSDLSKAREGDVLRLSDYVVDEHTDDLDEVDEHDEH